jgi:sugar transferase (PEP-CTERM/EpsH1 system associated)
VDAEYFAPDPQRPSPYVDGEIPLVFTGAMDYWPNVDAMAWFVPTAMPSLRQAWPAAKLYIVGRNPAPAVRALAGDAVVVTGAVNDVRPYLQHARVVVAPLRVARGIQNKILEAMAMARPVVAAAECAQALEVHPHEGVVEAVSTEEYVASVDALLSDRARADDIGRAGRDRVQRSYAWASRLAAIDRHLLAPEVALP